jgi:hypothetical protein
VASDIGATAVVCKQFSICSLGCGWLNRAASRLECEQWYVRMAILEGSVGNLLDVGVATQNFVNVEGLSKSWLFHLRLSVSCLLLP